MFQIKSNIAYYGVEGKYTTVITENINNVEENKQDPPIAPNSKESNKKKIPFLGAVFQLMSVLVSVNALTIPAGFRSLGLISAIVGTVIVAGVSAYGLLAIAHTSNHFRVVDGIEGRPLFKVAERSMQNLHIFQNTSYPKIFGIFVSILIVLNLMAVLTLNITLTVNNLKEASYSIGVNGITGKIFLLLLIPIVGLLASIRNPKTITSIASIGTLSVISGIMANLIHVTNDLITNGPGDVKIFKNLDEFPVFLGIIVFAFGGAIVIVPIQNSMAQPKKMSKRWSVIALAIIIATIILLSSGVLGYSTYGSSTKAQLNLHLPEHSWLGIVLQLLMATGVVFSTPVLFQSVMEQVLYYFHKKPSPCLEIVIRLILVVSTFILPFLVRDVLKVAQLMSTSLTLSQYVVPPFMIFATFWNEWTIKQKIVHGIISTVLIAFGILALVSGFSAI